MSSTELKPWYDQIPDEAFGNPRLDDIFRLVALKRHSTISKVHFRGMVSDERYKEMEETIVKLGFRKYDIFYKFPAVVEVEEEDADWLNGYNTFAEVDTTEAFKNKKDTTFVGCSVFLRHDGYMTYSHGGDSLTSSISILLEADSLPEEISDIKRFFEKQKGKRQPIKMFTSINGDFDVSDVGNIGLNLIRENYTNKVLEGYDNVVETLLSSNNSHGSIVVLEGAPGTGKSFLIRGLMEALDATFIFIPVNDVETLVKPAVIPLLLDQYSSSGKKPIVLIIEDGDQTILSRTEQTNSLISTVLNMGDGILGELLHTKMIISTNIPKAKIDEAVLRPGRLNSYIEVGKVEPAHAEEIYKRLSGEDKKFTSNVSLAEIYAAANDSKNMFKIEKRKEESGRYA